MWPAHLEDRAWRFSFFGEELEAIVEFDPLTGEKTGDLKSVKIYANSHYVTPRPALNSAIKSIKEELKIRLEELEKAGRLLEAFGRLTGKRSARAKGKAARARGRGRSAKGRGKRRAGR